MRTDRGGEEDGRRVEEVGIGVGYNCLPDVAGAGGDAWARRFVGRGRDGEEEKGSKAGSSDGAGRFMPATGEGGKGTRCGEEVILSQLKGSCEHARGGKSLLIVGAD